MRITRQLIIIFFLAGLAPPLFFLIQDVLAGAVEGDQAYWQHFFRACFSSTFITLSISLTVVKVLIELNHYLPWREGIFKRLLAEVFLSYPIAMGMIVLINFVLNGFSFPDRATLSFDISVAMIMNTILVSVTEGIFFFQYWKASLLEQERLEKAHISSQFEALKNQVNPHFLFNSLSILSSLVHRDPQKAEDFIDEFASVYRYVLDVRDRNTVLLKEELSFLQSFIYLHKIRFGDSLKVEIHLDSQLLSMCVPPFSLQLLVENAIKHNVVSKEDPLCIQIFDENACIVVKNNLQPKEVFSKKTGLGLQNLNERYQMLSERAPSFVITEHAYVARIPLIPSAHESHHR